jgi:hypoxanthine-guanine phosphoribosyltransferase
LNKPTLFIGFAETATGLGHSVFSAFDNTHYVHTTREEISDIKSVFDFEEEHSHATDHRCYLKNGDLMESAEHIVLVDDEITTGKTSINLIRALHQVYPKKEFSVLALLDWRNEEQQAAFVALEKELGAKIRVISLTRGNMQVTKEAFFTDNKERFEIKPASYEVISQKMAPFVQVLDIKKNAVSYPMYTGRFGLSSDMHDEIEEASQKIGEEIQSLRSGKRTLVLGTGEFMYIPSRIASYCGDGITHKTTTRSPIFPVNNDNYPIRERIQYVDDHGVNYFAYNLESNQYDDVFILSEKTMSKRMLEEISSEMNRCGIQKVSFIYV